MGLLWAVLLDRMWGPPDGGPGRVPLFSRAALWFLDRQRLDPRAKGQFEVMSGGLLWPDELPQVGSTLVFRGYAFRFLLAYRAALTLGEQREGAHPLWEQVVRRAPGWPGLRSERRGEQAARRLRAALRRQDRCFAALDPRPEATGLEP